MREERKDDSSRTSDNDGTIDVFTCRSPIANAH